MVNVHKLQKVLDSLVSDLSRWNQGNWIKTTQPVLTRWNQHPVVPEVDCGTSFCVAGEALVKNGYTFVGWSNELVFDHVVKNEHVDMFLKGGDVVDTILAKEAAADVLELTKGQADALFYSENTMKDIFVLANLFTDGEIVIPESLPAHENQEDCPDFRDQVLDVDAEDLYDAVRSEMGW